MSWTSAFPVLSDEMVREHSTAASKAEKAELEEWFGVQEIINPTPGPQNLVSFSLFWKNRESTDPELPTLDRPTLKDARQRGLVQRYDPWSHYVQPLLDGATLILRNRRDVAFRVYLAADLKFLAKDLVEAGCEVYLMKGSSLRHNPGDVALSCARGKWAAGDDCGFGSCADGRGRPAANHGMPQGRPGDVAGAGVGRLLREG